MDLIAIFLALAAKIPIIVVLVVALILALVRRRRHPQVSRLVVTYAILDLILTVGGSVLYAVLPGHLIARGVTGPQMGTIFGMVGAVHTVLHAATLIILLCAAFGWRETKSAP